MVRRKHADKDRTADVLPIAKGRSRRIAKREGERIRCRAHLAYVASRPCSVPGCTAPANVHHLTCSPEPKARGLKAGDNWTVPLCQVHHQGPGSVHHTGDERAWWAARGLDPIAIASRLWRASVAAGRVRIQNEGKAA